MSIQACILFCCHLLVYISERISLYVLCVCNMYCIVTNAFQSGFECFSYINLVMPLLSRLCCRCVLLLVLFYFFFFLFFVSFPNSQLTMIEKVISCSRFLLIHIPKIYTIRIKYSGVNPYQSILECELMRRKEME